ncbi:MAG TPA: hypothetical protein VEJ63_11650, partial [Planctomycetota bacterium]|nr:hypothetical protein [Planctomycetota bacterium]
EESGLGAVGISFKVEGSGAQIPFTVRVQDPLNPRLELHGADYELNKAGEVNLVCDFPDQIVPAGNALWVTLRFEMPVTLLNSKIEIYRVPREQAFTEALEWRKFLLKGFYAIMSEARPWNTWWKPEDPENFFKKNGPYAWTVREIIDTLEQCRAIDKDGKDDVVRQYHQWIYRNITRHNPPPFTPKFATREGLPEWAVLVHQAWMQAREVPAWWLDNRLVATGEVGGVIGDDTDMLGNYGAFPMFERDGVGGRVLEMATKLAATAQIHNMEEGLNKHTTDALHAYEEGINLDSQMPYWFFGDPVYVERNLIATRSLGKISFITEKGHRHLRSQDELGSADLRFERKPVEDGGANFLMWHPAVEAAAYNRNPAVLKLLREYADAWMEHQEPGNYASLIDVVTEKTKVGSPVPFEGLYGFQATFFTYVADVTNDSKYIRPMIEHINAFEPGEWKRPDGKMVPKQVAHNVRTHIPELMQMGMLNVNADKKEYCDTAHWQASLFTKGDKKPFIEAIKGDIEELQRYKHMYTSVECFTDRVFLYALINPSIAYTGGYTTRNKLNRNYAVSWDGFGTEYAALVVGSSRSHLKVLLCNLSDKALNGRGMVLRLESGSYELTFGPDANNDDVIEKIERKETLELAPGVEVQLTLPPKQVSVLELKQLPANKRDDFYGRPDVALSPLDVKVEGGRVSAVAHNIGNVDAENVEVALLDAEGKVLEKKVLEKLKAPLDLTPTRVPFEFALPVDGKGLSLVIDPAGKIAEIYEGNNRVKLP